MSHGFERKLRVADHIRNELGRLLLTHSHDPRFKFVSISAVELSKDYSHAKVFVTVLNDSQVPEILEALTKAAGFFRRELARIINLRSTPKLFFVYDGTLRQGDRISQLLSKPSDDDASTE